MSDIDRVKQTIRDLLNLAENDAAAEGEVNNAIRFARRLMDAHHLSVEECRTDPHAAAAQEEVIGAVNVHGLTRGLASWEGWLGAFVETLIGSVCCYSTPVREIRNAAGRLMFDDAGKPVERASLVFCGPQEEAALAATLFEDLRTTIGAMARLRFGGALKGRGRSYGDGFVTGLFRTLKESRSSDEAASSESRALVVRSQALALEKKNRVLQWLKREQGVRLRNVSRGGSAAHHDEAYVEGHVDGRRANVEVNRKKKLAGEGQRALPAPR